MNSTLRVLWDIFCLRGTPADLPATSSLVWVAVVALVLIQVLQAMWIPSELDVPILLAVAQPVGPIIWCWVILRVFARSERLPQTLLAVLGVVCIIEIISTPFALSLAANADVSKSTIKLSWQFLPLFALGVYGLYVNARVVRAAIERPMFQCLMLVFSGEMLTGMATVVLFAAKGATP